MTDINKQPLATVESIQRELDYLRRDRDVLKAAIDEGFPEHAPPLFNSEIIEPLVLNDEAWQKEVQERTSEQHKRLIELESEIAATEARLLAAKAGQA